MTNENSWFPPPHLRCRDTTQKLMLDVIIALIPRRSPRLSSSAGGHCSFSP